VIIPIFKTHYSIGKSILSLAPEGGSTESGPDSVIDIAIDNEINDLFLVEDSFVGFLEARSACEKSDINLIFGISLNICNNLSNIEEGEKNIPFHKINIFSKSSTGCQILYKIYTEIHCDHNGIGDLDLIKKYWDQDHLSMTIPFYDSFIFKNLFTFDIFSPSFSEFSPVFFIEEKGLPYDDFLKRSVVSYADSNDFETQNTHSIYYKNKKDFDAFVSYKLICSRGSYGGFKSSLEKPNLDHMSSDEFSFESYLQKCET
tara:strand:- start:1968 stop:2744 length:777 start_codon:yes stop_codon:yes gene_type:complete